MTGPRRMKNGKLQTVYMATEIIRGKARWATILNTQPKCGYVVLGGLGPLEGGGGEPGRSRRNMVTRAMENMIAVGCRR